MLFSLATGAVPCGNPAFAAAVRDAMPRIDTLGHRMRALVKHHAHVHGWMYAEIMHQPPPPFWMQDVA